MLRTRASATRLVRAPLMVLMAVAAVLVAIPAVPAFAGPWNTAAAIRRAQWYLKPMGVSRAWSVTRGAGVQVGVVDTGVDDSVPDLKGTVIAGKDFSGKGNSSGTKPVADDGHGTGVASLLAGRGQGPHRRGGVIGTAPKVGLLSGSIDDSSAAQVEAKQIGSAIRWVTDHGARVINVSIAGSLSPVVRAAVKYAQAHDVVVVAGAGNVGGVASVDYPAALPGVVSVSGVDKNGRMDPSSTRDGHVVGPFATRAVKPATDYGTAGLPVAAAADDPHQVYYLSQIGTSLATPIVAGIVALIRAKFPHLDAANVINRLLRTASPHPGSPGHDGEYGWGLPNAYKALTAKVPKVSRNPLGSLAPAPKTGSGAPSASQSPSVSPSMSPSMSPSVSPSRTVDSPPASSPPPVQSSTAQAASGNGSGGGFPVAIVVPVIVVVVLLAGGAGWWAYRRRGSPAR